MYLCICVYIFKPIYFPNFLISSIIKLHHFLQCFIYTHLLCAFLCMCILLLTLESYIRVYAYTCRCWCVYAWTCVYISTYLFTYCHSLIYSLFGVSGMALERVHVLRTGGWGWFGNTCQIYHYCCSLFYIKEKKDKVLEGQQQRQRRQLLPTSDCLLSAVMLLSLLLETGRSRDNAHCVIMFLV